MNAPLEKNMGTKQLRLRIRRHEAEAFGAKASASAYRLLALRRQEIILRFLIGS